MQREFLITLEKAATSVGPAIVPSPYPDRLSDKSWSALVRGRRMRFLDWLTQAGLRALDLVPQTEKRFLAFTEREPVTDLYETAYQLVQWDPYWAGLAEYFRLLAIYEAALIQIQKRRPPVVEAELRPGSLVALAPGVRMEEISSFAPVAHDRIPDEVLGPTCAAKIVAEIEALFHSHPWEVSVHLIILATDDSLGALVALDRETAAALRGLADGRAMCRSALETQVGERTFAALHRRGIFQQVEEERS